MMLDLVFLVNFLCLSTAATKGESRFESSQHKNLYAAHAVVTDKWGPMRLFIDYELLRTNNERLKNPMQCFEVGQVIKFDDGFNVTCTEGDIVNDFVFEKIKSTCDSFAKFISELFQVRQVESLTLDGYNPMKPMNITTHKNIDYYLAIYVNMMTDPNVAGRASGYYIEGVDHDRPIYGTIEITPNSINSLYTLLQHEVFHAFGFTDFFFTKYYNQETVRPYNHNELQVCQLYNKEYIVLTNDYLKDWAIKR